MTRTTFMHVHHFLLLLHLSLSLISFISTHTTALVAAPNHLRNLHYALGIAVPHMPRLPKRAGDMAPIPSAVARDQTVRQHPSTAIFAGERVVEQDPVAIVRDYPVLLQLHLRDEIRLGTAR